MPPAPEYVATVRLFVASVARHFGLAEEVLEDLKVAVSEACNDAISQASGPVSVQMRAPDDGRLEVEITGPPGHGETDPRLLVVGASPAMPEVPEEGIGVALIRALFPDVAVETVDGRRTLRLTLPLIRA